jgi:hypothetical protein
MQNDKGKAPLGKRAGLYLLMLLRLIVDVRRSPKSALRATAALATHSPYLFYAAVA